ncbi:hypothetical protein G3M48_005386 [Beauveria asiatica]|uniref:Uncharacterized protein n=1 Tax=Beauveria asiatica TaxID=1069075 RepID=A0AAW0RRK4_9HYPO
MHLKVTKKIYWVVCGPEGTETKALLEAEWNSVEGTFRERAEVKTIKSLDKTSFIFDDPEHSVVMVMEAGSIKLNSDLIALTSRLKAFAMEGGTVLYGGLIAPIISAKEFNSIFGEDGFNLGWEWLRYSGYANKSYDAKVKGVLNCIAEVYENNSLDLQFAKLPQEIDPFRPLVVAVQNSSHVLYRVEDHQDSRGIKYNAAVVMAPVGKGFVGFCGDRDNAAQTRQIMAAMASLPRKE